MSRSYYEWMEAKHAWYIAQQGRIASIPYPDNHSVVYQRKSNNPFWERRRLTAYDSIPFSFNLKFDPTQVLSFLRTAALYEQQKEDDFLSRFFNHSPSLQSLSRTDKFNTLFQGHDIYSKVNQRIKNVLSGSIKKGDQSNFKGMAPNLSSLFGSYLQTELGHTLQNLREIITPSTDLNSPTITRKLEECFTEAVFRASERMTQITKENGYGIGDEWAPIDAVLRQDERARQLFLDSVFNAIGAQNFMEVMKTMQKQKTSIKKQRTTAIARQHLKLDKQTAQIGGTVVENAMAALAMYINGMSGGTDNLKYQMRAEGVEKNMVKTDTIMVFSESMSINLEDVIQDLNDKLSSNTGSLLNAFEKVEDFYSKWEKDLDQLYTVFINSKNYGIGAGGHDYKDEQNGTLEELPEFLGRAGINVGNIDNFLSVAYNTGAGAICESLRDDVIENATNALKAAASKLMFDDYQSLGVNNGGAKSIHMYYLSGKYVPASVVFNLMADAAEEGKINSQAIITLPDKIEDKGPEWEDLPKDTDADFKEALWKYWQDEYERARRASTWYVSFTLKIRQILSKV